MSVNLLEKHNIGREITKSKHHLVKELTETLSIDKVNELVKNGWILINCVQEPCEEIIFKFLLGRIE